MQHAALALLLQAPLVIWLIVAWRRRLWTRIDAVAVGLVVWTLLQAAAIAYTRGAGLPEDRPLSRYHDPLLLGIAAQAYAALRLWTAAARPGRLLAFGWTALFLLGALQLTTTNLSLHLPYKRAQDAAGLASVREYQVTENVSALEGAPMLHPDPRKLQHVLDDVALRPVLAEAHSHNADRNRD